MAQERKSNNRGQEPTNGGRSASTSEANKPREQMGDTLKRRSEEVVQSAREHYDDAREAVEHGYRRTEGMIARNPSRSVMLGFGLGLGAGLLLVALFAREEEERWYERHLPERLRDMPDRLRAMSVPESLRDLPSRLRHLPDQVLERLGA